MIYRIQPLQDARWADLVDHHPHASVFHTVPWLTALHLTYRYEPVAFTTSPPGAPLENGIAFCRVASWITGRRLVSLPFSDHCEPLWNADMFEPELEQALRREKLRYVEVRGRERLGAWSAGQTYCFHELDLRPDLATLFANCHKSSTQRKIQRTERERLTCETGRSPELLDAFWRLLLLTRRRHRIPPQPKRWFRNLVDCFGEALKVRIAFQEDRPVAAILTLRHRDTLVYKYGCSDERFNTLGGTQLLFWRAIEEAKRDGLLRFDLGRSDAGNAGLIVFKDRWGAAGSSLTYSRLSDAPPDRAGDGWAGRLAKRVLPRLPDRLFAIVGNLLYKHVA